MAEFEIVDEYTYEVCLLPYEKAFGFADYLISKGINAKVKERYNNRFGVYVTNEIDAINAKREVLKYCQSPFDSSFTKASWEKGEKKSKSRIQGAAMYFPLAFSFKSVVTVIEIICVLLFLISCVDEEFVIGTFALSRLETFSDPLNYYKLLTPIFVHYGLLHICFNLVMFEAIGRPVERLLGTVRMFTLVISIALLSNVLQYSFMPDYSSTFGGLSGVVYGVIGYAGIISRKEGLSERLNFPNGLLAVSAVFILLGFFLSGIANLCHLAGLIIGIGWGYYDCSRRYR